jgi:N-6 DNA Methylase
MTPFETYLTSLREIRSSGEAVDETSYYGVLETFFNEIGKTLKPKVRCVLQLKNRGVGNPDGGLFTEDQLKKRKPEEKSLPQNPARGVIEIKPTSDDAWVTAEGEQVSRYWGKYRQVLVTNYRDFVIVGQDPSGKPAKLESYRLAGSEKEFWNATAHPKKAAAVHDVTFAEYARRVMLHAAPLAAPEDLASFLASYARDALARIGSHDLPALASVRKALEEALGLTFEGQKGEHFFRSTLVQTLFYGIFSAWVLWSKQVKPLSKELFDWRLTAHYLRVPVLRKLFHEVADPGQLEDLNLAEILDWTAAVLNRVDRPVFFAKFQEAHAVQYFYEPFLQAFDPELRKQLGVWYTPPEIVQYMVARVDTVLREELNLPDGLADKNVYVLDPCCGTGSYLVEVLKKIHETLKQRGDDALTSADLKEAAKNRVFGFELLPAPFVVSHLQIGLLLQNLDAPLAEKGSERIGVYLTNSLTGWEPPKGPKKHLLFPELEEERDAAEHVKRDTPILVILGNPPYNAFAGVSPAEEQGLVEPYKEGLVKEWKIKKFNLDDLYVRFFRLAERRIAEMSGRGVVSYISNHSWISDPSFVVMRKHLFNSFDRFWIENMHGNRKISEYAPDGRTSETIFAIPGFSVGIQQGVAISLWAKNGKAPNDRILFREDLNEARAVDRRKKLVESLSAPDWEKHYAAAYPSPANRFSFRPQKVSRKYMAWPSLDSLCQFKPTLGILENRQESLIDIDKEALEARLRTYLNPDIKWDEAKYPAVGIYKNSLDLMPGKRVKNF